MGLLLAFCLYSLLACFVDARPQNRTAASFLGHYREEKPPAFQLNRHIHSTALQDSCSGARTLGAIWTDLLDIVKGESCEETLAMLKATEFDLMAHDTRMLIVKAQSQICAIDDEELGAIESVLEQIWQKKTMCSGLRVTNNANYSVTISISPSALTTPNGVQNISIDWQHAQAMTSGNNDWIGIYSPSDSENDQYLDFFNVNGQPNGSYQTRVWNMRDSYQARYFTTTDDSQYVLQGVSNEASVIPHQPLQVHISLTDASPFEMQIRWVSSLIPQPTAQIGTVSRRYTTNISATYYTYDTSYMCGSTASIVSPTQFRDPGFIYTTIATKLQPDTTYYYRVGNGMLWSGEYSFTTSSLDSQKPFQFVMYGDQGTYRDAFATVANIENILSDIDLVLHVGDISYAWGNGYRWEIWSNMVANIAANVAYMVSIGNHEYDHTSECNRGGPDLSGVGGDGYHPVWGNQHDDSNGECGAPTYYRFNASLNGNSIFWYSFNYNAAHFIMLSSEHNYSANAPGFQWLRNDLQLVDRTQTPWVIVGIHRPLYESEVDPDDTEVSAHLIELLEPTLYEYKVDLLLAGHYHAYERVCAVYNYTCVGQENGGITHLTIGAAGYPLDDDQKYRDVDWSVYRNEVDFGFGRFHVNYTHLVSEFVTNGAGVVDSVVLTK